MFKYLRKKVSFAAKGKAVGIPGAHRLEFHEWRGDSPLPPYIGQIPTMVVMVTKGAAAFTRDGGTVLAGPGDAILIEAGVGELQFLRANIGGVVLVQIIIFDERSMAKIWCSDPIAEAIAFALPDFPACGIQLKGFVNKIAGPRSVTAFLGIPAPPIVLRFVFDGSWPRAFGLARSLFYKNRWRLHAQLERNVLRPDWEKQIGKSYSGGIHRFRRDCRIYAGCTPERWIKRRKIELAMLWIQCGCEVDRIAQTLGIADLWTFKCALTGAMRMSWARILNVPPLSGLTADELVEMLRPWWWPMPLPFSERLQPLLERCLVPEEPWLTALLNEENPSRRAQRAKAEEPGATKLLAQLDAELFSMKSTAAGIVVPIFDLPGFALNAVQNLAEAA